MTHAPLLRRILTGLLATNGSEPHGNYRLPVGYGLPHRVLARLVGVSLPHTVSPASGTPAAPWTNLEAVTIPWKSADALDRLASRALLVSYAGHLKNAHDRAADIASEVAVTGTLDRARALAFFRAVLCAYRFTDTLTYRANVSYLLDRSFESDLESVRDPLRDLSHLLDTASSTESAYDAASFPGDGLTYDYGKSVRVNDRMLVRHLNGAQNFARGLQAAADNAMAAAADFTDADLTGADLSGADLRSTDLVGARWDLLTRWPTSQWAERMRRMSVEDPPHSGRFTVWAEGGHSRAHTPSKV